jgi:small subunit ribosomal protein S17e
MGRIKSTLIKRTARSLLKEEIKFTEKFEDNKNILGTTMPSKRLRNKIAGYITRINKDAQKKQVAPVEPVGLDEASEIAEL